MEEQWVIRRIIKTTTHITRKDRTTGTLLMENITTGKADNLVDAIINFQTNDRINYERSHFVPVPYPERLRSYQY